MSGNGREKPHTSVVTDKKHNAHSCAAFPVERWLAKAAICPIYLIIYHKCVILGRKQHKEEGVHAKAKVLNEANVCLHLAGGLKCFS